MTATKILGVTILVAAAGALIWLTVQVLNDPLLTKAFGIAVLVTVALLIVAWAIREVFE